MFIHRIPLKKSWSKLNINWGHIYLDLDPKTLCIGYEL